MSETEEVFSLDAVAREIWLAVQRTNSVDGAVAEVLPLYKVDAETLRRDAEALLRVHRGSRLARVAFVALLLRRPFGIVG